MNLDIKENSIDEKAEGKLIQSFNSGCGTHYLYQLVDGYKFVFYTLGNVLAGAMQSTSDFFQNTLSLYGGSQQQSYALVNALMAAFTFSSAAHHILMMHASVIVHQGKGFLFLGKSGTGKSTHARLWLQHISDCELLNDDNPAIRISEKGEILVYGTPWSGKTPCYRNLHFPIQAFVRLEQYPRNVIRKEIPLQAFSSILSSSSNMIWDPPFHRLITQTVEQVAMNTHSYYLKCLPDQEAALLCHQTVTQPHA